MKRPPPPDHTIRVTYPHGSAWEALHRKLARLAASEPNLGARDLARELLRDVEKWRRAEAQACSCDRRGRGKKERR